MSARGRITKAIINGGFTEKETEIIAQEITNK